MTKIDGTNKVAEHVRHSLNQYGSCRITAATMADAATTYERVFRALGGEAKDVTYNHTLDTWTFHRECQHSEVEEEYTRLGGMRYRVDSTCTRCRAKVASFARTGGETAQRAVKRKEDWARLPDEEGDSGREGEHEEGGEGRDQPDGGEGQPEDGEGKGEGDPEDGEAQEGEGEPDENEGGGDAEEGGEGEGEGEQDEDGEAGEAGEGEQQGEGDEGGEGECGASSDEEGDGESDGDPWAAAFGRIWNSTLTEEERAAIYHRIAFFKESAALPAALLEYERSES